MFGYGVMEGEPNSSIWKGFRIDGLQLDDANLCTRHNILHG
jgi:hypothetical protein